ncbi:hypothetical protein PybrP1_007169 [[Pythium] brassicae (nom. inval.)]|nr:hypothetical protein PybrP1_007169 [[Pythium] brassicae (nom. inval.)]
MQAALKTVAFVALALLAATGVESASECCSTCIGKVASTPYDYDPLDFTQCSVAGSKRVCCFDCGAMGVPTYGETISYAADGTTPTVKTGTWIKMKWSDIKNVTYITLKENQKKTVTPTIGDTAAEFQSNYFMICAKSVGQIVFRGWGDQPCREASLEKSVTVLQGAAGATCEAAEPVKPNTPTASPSAGSTSGSASLDASLDDCNLQRASIKTVDGKKECVCVSDWAGAPACDQMPTWKWVVTIGGGVAALLSILISVRAFMKSREKKRLAEEEDSTPRLGSRKDDVEILQITPDRRSGEMTAPSNAPYAQPPYARENSRAGSAPYARENNRAGSVPRKADDREFTL